MQIRFLEIASQELDDAIAYYNNELAGLGDKFLAEVLNALERVARYPKAWHPYTERTRRCLIKSFPYGVIYQIRDEEILVVAVANLHRKPEYWRGRHR